MSLRVASSIGVCELRSNLSGVRGIPESGTLRAATTREDNVCEIAIHTGLVRSLICAARIFDERIIDPETLEIYEARLARKLAG